MRSTLLALCAISFSVIPVSQAAPRVAKAVAANSPAAPTSVRTSSSVVLRPNDMIQLHMGGMPPDDAQPFSTTPYTVSGDGQVNIPYVGPLPAAGRTTSELERAIERALVDKKIFRSPTATINIDAPASLRTVTIGGNVRAPGRTQWSPDLTLMSSIADHGGPGDFAGDKINLIRDGKITVYRYKQLQKDPSQDPRLQPGDQVDLR